MLSQSAVPNFSAVVVQSRQESTRGHWLFYIVAILIYKFLLDQSYEQISISFAYQQFFYDGRTIESQAISWILAIVAIPAIKHVFESKSISGNVFAILILFSVIPTISAISFRSDYGFIYIFLMTIFWTTFFVAWRMMKPIRFPRLARLQSKFYLLVLLILCGAVLIYSYINTGIRLHFDLIEVYDIRAEARTFSAPFPLNYIVSLADNILPILMVYLLTRRNWLLATLTFFIIFINFSISGQKTAMFAPFLGAIGFFVFDKTVPTKMLLVMSCIFTFLATWQTIVYDNNTLTGLFTYRVLFIPAELHYSYFRYFQYHDFLYFSQSFLRFFGDLGQENIQFLIGEYAIGDFSARANNGLFSDAYLNLGAIGVLIYPVIFALYLRILDGAAAALPKRMLFVIVLCVGFILISMTLPVALVTSGLIFLIFLLYTLPGDQKMQPAATPRTMRDVY